MSETQHDKNNISVTTIANFKEMVKAHTGRLTAQDVAVVNAEDATPQFATSAVSSAEFANKIKELGFDLDPSQIAVVTAENLDAPAVTQGKKFKK
jgi:hypothetical protein